MLLSKEDLRKIDTYAEKGRTDLNKLSTEERDDFARLLFLWLVEGELADLGGLYSLEYRRLLANTDADGRRMD